jgi:demethylphylloquinone reductase
MLPPPSTVNLHPQICILGGGFAGLYTALHLSKMSWGNGLKPEIILVDQNDRFLFTPFLYELVTGELQTWEIAPTFKQLLHKTNVRFYQGTVQGVDLEKRQVYLHEGDVLTYDRLVLAVGGESCMDTVPGAEDYAYPFRTLSDAQHLKEQLRFLEVSDRETIHVVIAGGGPSGVELAGKLADRLGNRGHIHLVERGNQLLKAFTRFSSKAAYRGLASRGVQIHLQTGIHAVEPQHVVLEMGDRLERIPSDLTLWTVGTQTSHWLRAPACESNRQGRVQALPTLQLPDHPEVFAMGDVAIIRDASGKQVPATAQAAYQQASCTAHNIRASLLLLRPRRFRYLHLGEMLALGTKAGLVSSFGINLSGSLGYVTRRLVYLLLRMPTLRHRVVVARHWLMSLLSQWIPGRAKPLNHTRKTVHSHEQLESNRERPDRAALKKQSVLRRRKEL